MQHLIVTMVTGDQQASICYKWMGLLVEPLFRLYHGHVTVLYSTSPALGACYKRYSLRAVLSETPMRFRICGADPEPHRCFVCLVLSLLLNAKSFCKRIGQWLLSVLSVLSFSVQAFLLNFVKTLSQSLRKKLRI